MEGAVEVLEGEFDVGGVVEVVAIAYIFGAESYRLYWFSSESSEGDSVYRESYLKNRAVDDLDDWNRGHVIK